MITRVVREINERASLVMLVVVVVMVVTLVGVVEAVIKAVADVIVELLGDVLGVLLGEFDICNSEGCALDPVLGLTEGLGGLLAVDVVDTHPVVLCMNTSSHVDELCV